MRVGLVTREWPPDVYGGAGVHVEFLARELQRLVELSVRPFAEFPPWHELQETNPALAVFSTDLAITAASATVDLVHSHTWYANLAGHLTALLYDVPHVMTAHSLEPLRPWKAEQLGGGYALSCWAERTAIESADAVIAVSAGMRADVLSTYPAVAAERVHVVHNGIDTELFAPRPDPAYLSSLGLDPDRPVVLYVGRVTRQKGLPHLLRAMRSVAADAQLVVAASSPDTPEIAAEVAAEIDQLAARRPVVHLDAVVPRPQLIGLLSSADVFVCPSVYEPLGIVNLEAMACGTAVVAGAVGGIPEVVRDGETGLLVGYEAADPAAYEAGLAAAIDAVVGDPERAARLGTAGRERAIQEFSWRRIAEQTVGVYEVAARR